MFKHICEKWGPFQWDIMASASNVQKNLQGNRLNFFSRYHDPLSKGVDVFSRNLILLEGIYCFPPIPMIGKLLKHLQAQKVQCVLVIPSTNSSWVNLVSSYIQDLMVVTQLYSGKAFSVLNAQGKRIPKKFPHAMLAVKLNFAFESKTLKQLHG